MDVCFQYVFILFVSLLTDFGMILTTLPYLMDYLLYDDNLYIATVGKILHLMQNATQDQTEISRTSYGVQFEQFL